GLALAGVLVLTAWGVRRRLPPPWRFRLLLVCLAGFGMALFWLPPALRELAWWPALTTLALAVVWYLWSTVASQLRSPAAAAPGKGAAGAAGQAAAAVLILAGLAGLGGEAAAPAPYTVLLVPESADHPDRLTALVPPDLLKRLDEWAGRGPAA